jgi:hypothetical protein
MNSGWLARDNWPFTRNGDGTVPGLCYFSPASGVSYRFSGENFHMRGIRGIKVATATLGLSAALAGTAVGLAGPASAACEGGYPRAQCTVALNDNRVRPGEEVGFRATGYEPGERVRGTVFSEPIRVGTWTANRNGVVQGRFTVPRRLSPGRHTFQLRGLESNVIKTARFTVVGRANNGNGNGNGNNNDSSLAFTGSDLALTAGAGAVLLAGGGALVIAARRRKHVNAGI